MHLIEVDGWKVMTWKRACNMFTVFLIRFDRVNGAL